MRDITAGMWVFVSDVMSKYPYPGIDEQGLYRIVGVNSRVQKLLSLTMGKTSLTKSKFI